MKRLILFALILLCALPAEAQQIFNEVKYKHFTLGAKMGLNASFPIVNSLYFNDHRIDDITMQNRVGYLFSLFGRINVRRFFLEPGVSWTHREGDMIFTIPSSYFNDNDITNETLTDKSTTVRMKENAIEVPFILGYYVVKEGAYGLSISAGPKFKYSYDSSYTVAFDNNKQTFSSEDSPYGISISMGVGVIISRLFFNFEYDFGLNKFESNFSDQEDFSTSDNYRVDVNKRMNVMSMSIGFLF